MSRQKVQTAAFLLEVCPACRLFRRGGRPHPSRPPRVSFAPVTRDLGRRGEGSPSQLGVSALSLGTHLKQSSQVLKNGGTALQYLKWLTNKDLVWLFAISLCSLDQGGPGAGGKAGRTWEEPWELPS